MSQAVQQETSSWRFESFIQTFLSTRWFFEAQFKEFLACDAFVAPRGLVLPDRGMNIVTVTETTQGGRSVTSCCCLNPQLRDFKH